MNGGVDHSLLECLGCDTVFYQTESWNSEEIDPYCDAMGETQYEVSKELSTYPKPETKTKPVWFDAMQKKDHQLHNILSQMYVALDNHANILTAIALRTALDRATEYLGIDPAKTFDEKLDELRHGGWIGETERDILGVVTDAGNAAAHRGWEPDNQEITQLFHRWKFSSTAHLSSGKRRSALRGTSRPSRGVCLPPSWHRQHHQRHHERIAP